MKDNNKEKYQDFCHKREGLPFFYKPWWMDAVCGAAKWNVCIAEDKGKNITGILPYFFQKKGPFKLIRMPILTPYSGILYAYPSKLIKEGSRVAFEKRTSRQLFSKLPKSGFFNQHLHPDIKNALPFNWAGFETHYMYTYQISLNEAKEVLEMNMKSSTRNEIKNAKQRFSFSEKVDLKQFLNVHKQTFSHQGKRVPFLDADISRVFEELKKHNKVKIFGVHTKSGHLSAAVFTVFDLNTIYTLMIGSDPQFRAGGAVQFLLWNVINKYQEHYMKLDFCGSMIEPIERVFRAMGAKQQPYIKIRQVNNIFLKLLRILTNKPA